MNYYEVELGTGYHIYTKYSVIADSEEEAIKKARSKQGDSNLTHHLLNELEYEYDKEFVSIYIEGPLTVGAAVEEIIL